MAGGHSDYNRGDMPIEGQKATFGGFMNWTVYGGAFLVVILLFPILVFAANFAWLPSLITTVVVGIVMGLALKLKGSWYASIIMLGIITAVIWAILSAIF